MRSSHENFSIAMITPVSPLRTKAVKSLLKLQALAPGI